MENENRENAEIVFSFSFILHRIEILNLKRRQRRRVILFHTLLDGNFWK